MMVRRLRQAPATVFSRLFSYLLAALLITNIALLGAMFLFSQRLIVSQAHRANISLLKSEAAAYRQSLAGERRVAVMLFQNESVKALMTQNAMSPLERIKAYKSVSDALVAHDSICSAYVINIRQGSVCVAGQGACFRTLGDFYDGDILRIIDAPPEGGYLPFYHTLDVPANVQMTRTDQHFQVYTVILGRYSAQNSRTPQGMLVLNFYASAELSSHAGDCYVLNENGTVVSTTDPGRFAENWSAEDAFREALTGEDISNSYVGEYAQEQYVVTYLRMPELSRTMIVLEKYDALSKSVQPLLRAATALSGAAVALCLVLSNLFSRRFLSNFTGLFRHISDFLDRNVSPDQLCLSDLDRFAQELARKNARLTDLEKYNQNTSAYMKEYALRRLLRGEAGDLPADVAIDPGRPVLFALLMFSRGEQPMSRFSLETMLKRQLPGLTWEALSLDGDCEKWLLICQGPASAPHEKAAESFLAQFSDFQQLALSYSGQQLSGAVRTRVEDPSLWPAALDELTFWLEQRYCLGLDVLMTSPPEMDREWSMGYFSFQAEEMKQALLSGSADTVEAKWNAIGACLKTAPAEQARGAVNHLTYQLVSILSAAEREGGWSAGMEYGQIEEAVRLVERLPDALRALRRVTDAILTHAAARDPSDKVTSICLFVQQYVQKHLSEPGLNANDISDQLHLSCTYLNRIYRQHTGESISAHIRACRLKEAVRLFAEQPARAMEDILDEVGWENKKYFYTVFKQTYGMTPSEYRLQDNMQKWRKSHDRAL